MSKLQRVIRLSLMIIIWAVICYGMYYFLWD